MHLSICSLLFLRLDPYPSMNVYVIANPRSFLIGLVSEKHCGAISMSLLLQTCLLFVHSQSKQKLSKFDFFSAKRVIVCLQTSFSQLHTHTHTHHTEKKSSKIRQLSSGHSRVEQFPPPHKPWEEEIIFRIFFLLIPYRVSVPFFFLNNSKSPIKIFLKLILGNS